MRRDICTELPAGIASQLPVCRVVCAPLSWSTGQNPNGKVWLEGLAHLHREGFLYQVRYLRFRWQPVDFLVWLRRL